MKNDEFETPQWLFDELNEEFHFSVDVASSTKNHKHPFRYICSSFDSLSQSWGNWINESESKNVFMNPPYSRHQLYKWCKKAYEESQKGVTVVGLLPVDTSTKWFHEWIYNPEPGRYDIDLPEIRFLPKRLKFCLNGIEQGPARFASMVVIWRGVK